MHIVWSCDYRSAGVCQCDELIITSVDDVGAAIAELRQIVDDDESLQISRVDRVGVLLNDPLPRLHRPPAA